MKLKIKKIDHSLPLPTYQTRGAVAFDLYSRIDLEILPGEIALIPSNLIIKVPSGWALVVVPRSSLPLKKKLLIPHGLGLIDQDFWGEEDEIKIQVLNFSKEITKIKRGERIAQAFLVKIKKPKILETKNLAKKSRGGFGSTDK